MPDGCIFRSVPAESVERKIRITHISQDFSLLHISSSTHPEDIRKTGKYKTKYQEEAESPFPLNSCGIKHSGSQLQNSYTLRHQAFQNLTVTQGPKDFLLLYGFLSLLFSQQQVRSARWPAWKREEILRSGHHPPDNRCSWNIIKPATGICEARYNKPVHLPPQTIKTSLKLMTWSISLNMYNTVYFILNNATHNNVIYFVWSDSNTFLIFLTNKGTAL